jgi:hypothetical protein
MSPDQPPPCPSCHRTLTVRISDHLVHRRVATGELNPRPRLLKSYICECGVTFLHADDAKDRPSTVSHSS